MQISETQIAIDRDDRAGLQAQLRERIVTAILRRHFPPGARMPSTRRLAEHLRVARITAVLAYQELVADGYLEARARSGVYVAADPPGLIRPDPARTADGIDWASRLGPALAGLDQVAKPADWRSYPFPFIHGQIDERLFPHSDWRDCARRALGRLEFHEIAADAGMADDPRVIAHTLSRSLPVRGIEAGHEEVLITLGAQNALWLAVETLSRGGRALRVAVEDPCYPELRNVLRVAGAEIHPVPVDANGLDPERLPAGLDLVCVCPGAQAPTGVALSEPRRRALLARAEAGDFLILEDDYDGEAGGEAGSDRRAAPALKARDGGARVIYAGSYSKPLFPGLRLGYLVAARPLVDAARALRSVSMRHPPGLTQRTVAHFLALGHYNAHLARVGRAIAERRAVLTAALREAGFRFDPAATGGAGVWVATPDGSDSAALARRARDVGVLIEPGAPFFAAGGPSPWFRMGVASVPTARIAEGVTRLAACLPPG